MILKPILGLVYNSNNSSEIYLTGSFGQGANQDVYIIKYSKSGVPEFMTIIFPTIAVIALFIVILKRKRKD